MARSKLRQLVSSDGWFNEFVALLIAYLSFAGMCVFLFKNDGTPVRQWYSITLNAIISVLGTVNRSMVILVASACLGQHKWIWYRKHPKPLNDFELLHEASRGPAGSVRLLSSGLWGLISGLWKTSGTNAGPIILLGCLVILITPIFDPTIQQIVAVEELLRWRPLDTARVPYAQRWSAADISIAFDGLTTFPVLYFGNVLSVAKPHVNFDTRAAIAAGFSSTTDKITQQFQPACEGGTCRWPKYKSLAVCSKCNDVASSIFRGVRPGVADLAAWFQDPNGVREEVSVAWFNLPTTPPITINNPLDYKASNGSTERITMTAQASWYSGFSVSFQNSSTLLATMSFVWADLDDEFRYPDWEHVDIRAAECALYLCVKEFHTEVTDGVVVESSKEISATRDPSSYQLIGNPAENITENIDLYGPEIDKNKRTDLEIAVMGDAGREVFGISQAGVCGLISYISQALDDGTLWHQLPSPDLTSIMRIQVITGISGMVRLLPGTHDFQYTPDVMEILWQGRGMQGLSSVFGNVAASLTNNLRMTADRGTSIPGEIGETIAVFKVRFLWTLPTFVTQILTTLFLLATWFSTRRSGTPIWKSSMLAVLFHGLSVRIKTSGIRQIWQHEMNKEAKGILVQLEERDGGICLDGTGFNHAKKKPGLITVEFENAVPESALRLFNSS